MPWPPVSSTLASALEQMLSQHTGMIRLCGTISVASSAGIKAPAGPLYALALYERAAFLFGLTPFTRERADKYEQNSCN